MSARSSQPPLSQDFLQAVLQQVSDLVLVLDPEGSVVRSFGASKLGFSDGEIEGRSSLDLVHPEDVNEAQAFFSRTREGLTDGLELRAQHANGTIRWYELAPARYVSPDEFLNIVVVARDIQERKIAEATIRDRERHYRSLVDQSPFGILIVDHELTVTLANQAYVEQVGAPDLEALRGHNILSSPALDNQAVDLVVSRVRNGETIQTAVSYRSIFGKQVDVRANIAPVLGDDGVAVGAQMIFEDISESRRLEEQLRQSQKMEAVGRVAGGIAHDFNNNLTVILGLADFLSESQNLKDEERRAAAEILQASERSAALTRQLLAFSRPSLATLSATDLGLVVSRVEPMLKRTLGESIRFSSQIEAELPPINADARLLEQVILNLALNARDAMPSGGELRLQVWTDGRGHVLLDVTDDGVGMDEPTRTRAIEPFFTTKEPGEGTGLGLSMVYGIVRQFGGSVEVKSEQGNGACFRLVFPALEAERAVDARAISVKGEDHQIPARELILVLEDQRPVRKFLSTTLRREGYDVLEAENGGQALELARAADPEIDLFLSDVRVPGVSGPEAVSELLVDRPDLRVLFISGYNDMAPDPEGRLDGFELLPKPFSSKRLLNRVRSSLDHSGHFG